MAKLDKIKTKKLQILFKEREVQQQEVAQALEIKKESFNNKIGGGNFTAAELIKIAEFTNTFLSFIDKQTGEVLIKFNTEDLKQKEDNNNE